MASLRSRLSSFSSSLIGRRCTAVLALLFVVALAADLAGAPNRDRLSRDLNDALDAGAQSYRVILQSDSTSIDASIARYGLTVHKRLKTGVVVEATREQLDALSADPSLGHIAGDTRVRSMMAVSAQATGADQVWAGTIAGLAAATGRGIGIAVIDSGVSNHLALQGRVVASIDFTQSSGTGIDGYGHGTHVAGIAAGSGSGFTGVAPGAHVVSLKVLGNDGMGQTSDVIAAIDWAIENRTQYGIRVINLSLGRPVFDSYRDDPLCQAVERAFRAGLVR